MTIGSASVIGWQLYSKLGALRLPVYLYIVTLAGMGVSASFYAPFNLLLVAGAWLFMASDAMIGIDKFLRPVPLRNYVVMSTYYAAQLLIIYALL
jgi:uncharacterized membrane protein YhhN